MQIDVIDVLRTNARTRECILQRQLRAEALRVRCRHMMRVARFAPTNQAWRGGVILTFDDRKSRRLAYRDTTTSRVERSTNITRNKLQRIEAKKYAAAQRIHAGQNRRVDNSEPY